MNAVARTTLGLAPIAYRDLLSRIAGSGNRDRAIPGALGTDVLRAPPAKGSRLSSLCRGLRDGYADGMSTRQR